ncbi:MAG: hypothetical protein AAF570_28600, partial [Bacteroidota bacterium]
MKKSSQRPLKLKPRKTDRVAKYPSWEDANPLEDAENRFPHSPKAKNALAVASLMACMAMSTFADGKGGDQPIIGGGDDSL